MSLWELSAAIDGWADAHVPEAQRGPSDADRDDMIEFLEEYRNQNGD
jgi:hypothetical protein